MHSSVVLDEPVMEIPSITEPMPSPQAESKPQLISFDSSQECSLEHLLELFKLVESEDRELKGYVFDDDYLRVSE
jgi:hypothetical protein